MIERKTVKPAHPDADIPDPGHANRPLPRDGIEVDWTPYWMARETRGEIVVVEPEADTPAPPTA